MVIMNDRTGQKMKEEIYRLADLYIATMSQAYGKEKLRVVRERTGPPM
jgi:hypothetical protein